MQIETNIKDDFLKMFYPPINKKLENNNTLDAFILRIANKDFSYNELVDALTDNIIPFVLSKKQMEEIGGFGGKKFRKAQEAFRTYVSNEGEFGEVLLYCFLESHLNAPKILSKYEIKTSNNDYVKGADGVHLLKLDTSNYQLIFGESKLHADLKQGIYEAFGSIIKFIKNGKIGFEKALVSSELAKEAINDESYMALKKILLPSAQDDEYNLDHSFGIFLGFDYTPSENISQLANQEARSEMRKEIEEVVTDVVSSLNYQLKKYEIMGHDFYIYIMPFSNLEEQRKKIIRELTQ